jgi:predicted enzyme related to lactoylglutathione lyase
MRDADLLGKFIWHELMTPDAQSAADFYSTVLPWTSEASTVPGYALWMRGPVGVAGLMPQPQSVRDSGTPPSWLVYIAAPDVDATVEAAQRLGGKLLKAPTDIPGIGRFAVLSDPLGAAFAVFTPAMAPPPGGTPEPLGRFSWHELATTDPLGALAFYAELFGWTRGPAHDMGAGGLYQIIEHAGVQIGGLHVLEDPSKPPRWLSYVQIEGLDAAIEAVGTLGGRVLRGPHVVPGGSRVAHILDPQGGLIALHEPARTAAPHRPARRAVAARNRKAVRKASVQAAPTRAKPARKKPARKKAVRKQRIQRAARPAGARVAKRAARKASRATQAATRRAPARKTAAKRSGRKPAASRPRAKQTRRRTTRRR